MCGHCCATLSRLVSPLIRIYLFPFGVLIKLQSGDDDDNSGLCFKSNFVFWQTFQSTSSLVVNYFDLTGESLIVVDVFVVV